MVKKQPNRLTRRVHDLIMTADRARGFTLWEIANTLKAIAARVTASADYLEDAELVESRWSNERWPNGDKAVIIQPVRSHRTRYYRLTCKTKQTLAARLRETLS